MAVILSVLPLGAGTIDVSTQASVFLDTGAALSFTVPSWNFGIDAAKFAEVAGKAKAGCPISRLLNAKITLAATLL